MSELESLSVSTPALPKGGGAIQSIGKGWSAVGVTGAASFTVALPTSPGRGFAPALALSYSSAGGKSEFGQGWAVALPAIARRTSRGVPAYSADDEFVTPGGDVLMPEVDQHGNPAIREEVHTFRGQALGSLHYNVQGYVPRVHGDGSRWESWRSSVEWFWMVHGADGTLHVYGKKTRTSATAEASDAPGNREPGERIAEWHLEESVAPNGEHILYEYVREDAKGLPGAEQLRDHQRRHYLARVRYGNTRADQFPFLLRDDPDGATSWHFDLIFDYGSRATGCDETPTFDASRDWPLRSDPYASFAYGFEVRTLRLCRQVLMFHTFTPVAADLRTHDGRRIITRSLGNDPVLVSRLLLEYECDATSSRLVAAHSMAYGEHGEIVHLPPMEFRHIPFPTPANARFEPFTALADSRGIQSERPVREPYQWVDLYGEGLPGVLAQDEQGWWYREPLRSHDDPDAVRFGPFTLLDRIPTAHAADISTRQWLADLTGDGKLEWIVARPGMAGFFTLNPDRQWSNFVTFGAFPLEFFDPQGQLADLLGAGLSDLAMIGTRSVRWYANKREAGFAPAVEVKHDDDDALPGISDDKQALIAFSDVLGSGQQHLIEIRYNRLSVWPNLGRGRFGKRMTFSPLPFDISEFDPLRIRLADLDGSGAADLIYLQSDCIQVFMNHSGNRLADPVEVPWPEGVRYDRLCEVSAADLQGLGCSSLVLTVTHMTPRHWRCDFVPNRKPYLIDASDNNMGAASEVVYRSSAQEWLDEKAEKMQAGKRPVCQVPFPIHAVSVQRQIDQISGNVLSQHYQYRDGYYDGSEREFRGFGLLIQTDTEAPDERVEDGASPPQLTKTWYHVGAALDPSRDGFDDRDDHAMHPGATLCSNFNEREAQDEIDGRWDEATRHDAARALSGLVRRIEIYGIEEDAPDIPYSTAETRYLVRKLRPRSDKCRYSQMQPFAVETISYQYERDFGDPQCQQAISLRWDKHGGATHGAVIHHARRLNAHSPFPDTMRDVEHHRRWWLDSHDDAQRAYYISETRSASIHMEDTDYWRLHFPFKRLDRAAAIARDELSSETLNYESLIGPDSPLEDEGAGFVLTGQSLQRYKACNDGEANFEGLMDYTETAVLDKTALTAYEHVLNPEALKSELGKAGYYRMPSLFDPSLLHHAGSGTHHPLQADTNELWSIRSGFATYDTLENFHRVIRFKQTQHMDETSFNYDPYGLFLIEVRTPDGCTTIAEYDYRILQPRSISDPNQNISEARYDASGRVMVTSFHGTEHGQPAGFAPLAEYERKVETPDEAIHAPERAVQEAAAAYFFDAFSWMGQADSGLRQDVIDAGEARMLLQDGHLRASGRWRMAIEGETHLTPALQLLLLSLPREPVHAVALVADQYTYSATPLPHPMHMGTAQKGRLRQMPEKQIRISIESFDGFGRPLQVKQKVPSGLAYQTTDGVLDLDDEGKPVKAYTETRWHVSEPVEYNNKGLAVRVYRPYFADTHATVRDQGFRAATYFDRQYYDALGRPTVTLTASGWMRRATYYPWYSVSEDENDTAVEMEQSRSKPASGPVSSA